MKQLNNNNNKVGKENNTKNVARDNAAMTIIYLVGKPFFNQCYDFSAKNFNIFCV